MLLLLKIMVTIQGERSLRIYHYVPPVYHHLKILSRGFLKPYGLVYSRRKKTKLTQPPLDQPNDQLDAPRMGNPKVIPSPTLSIDTSIKELTQLNLESKTCYPSTK